MAPIKLQYPPIESDPKLKLQLTSTKLKVEISSIVDQLLFELVLRPSSSSDRKPSKIDPPINSPALKIYLKLFKHDIKLIINLLLKPHVTKRFPCISKSLKLPLWVSNECSTLRPLGSRKSILPSGFPAHTNLLWARNITQPVSPTSI